LVTIITPFLNAERYLEFSIKSVISQVYGSWELWLIDDGSTDSSDEIAQSFHDSRIKYVKQNNSGIAAARNVGLKNMHGDYFCFLDADDFLPPNSLESRLKVFEKHPEVSFVDGAVRKMGPELKVEYSVWKPSFCGNPLDDLVRLTGKPFFGPSWMIKRHPGVDYRMKEGLTHAEDLLYYMCLARKGGLYGFTEDVILHYRDTPGSAMTNLKGLESGYRYIEKEIRTWPEVSRRAFRTYQYKYRRAMFLAYLRKKQIGNALRSLL
jgi:teichuronic acid biosynthesis glycosyltransferase TuaG